MVDLVDTVSIPVRVLGWLQPPLKHPVTAAEPVSIPVRVLGWLQRLLAFVALAIDTVVGFNPCKGFGVVAAAMVLRTVERPTGVSIPVRVLGWLQRRVFE